MVVELSKTPKNVTIIEGFPGFGLIGTITSEFLMDHLQCELIGKIWLEEIPALAAIHSGNIVRPIGIYYSKKTNLILIHGVTATQRLEWKIADEIIEVAKRCQAKQIISIEGIGSATAQKNPQVFYYSSLLANAKEMDKVGMKKLQEGIIVGVTGALLLRVEKIPISAIFAETTSQMPDSRGAAGVIKILDLLLDLKVDPKPLLKQAEQFEGKLQTIMKNTQKAQDDSIERAKNLSYMG